MFIGQNEGPGFGGRNPAEKKETDSRKMRMLELVHDKDFKKVLDIITKTITDKSNEEFFFHGDSEFKLQYEKYKDGVPEENYYKFIDNVVNPFWEKVHAAGPAISDTYFTDLEGLN